MMNEASHNQDKCLGESYLRCSIVSIYHLVFSSTIGFWFG